jgi:hypothetical protein
VGKKLKKERGYVFCQHQNILTVGMSTLKITMGHVVVPIVVIMLD